MGQSTMFSAQQPLRVLGCQRTRVSLVRARGCVSPTLEQPSARGGGAGGRRVVLGAKGEGRGSRSELCIALLCVALRCLDDETVGR
jgi:hypothetical protein